MENTITLPPVLSCESSRGRGFSLGVDDGRKNWNLLDRPHLQSLVGMFENQRGMWYCVISIETGTVRYLGNSEDAAAVLWKPGTVLGVGKSRHEAQFVARKRAEGV